MINSTNLTPAFSGYATFMTKPKNLFMEQAQKELIKKTPTELELESKKLETMLTAVNLEIKSAMKSGQNEKLMADLRSQAAELQYKLLKNTEERFENLYR